MLLGWEGAAAREEGRSPSPPLLRRKEAVATSREEGGARRERGAAGMQGEGRRARLCERSGRVAAWELGHDSGGVGGCGWGVDCGKENLNSSIYTISWLPTLVVTGFWSIKYQSVPDAKLILKSFWILEH